MNKNVKKIIAMVLTLGVLSAVTPVADVNLLTTKAYATDDENDKTTLDSLELKNSAGDTIKLYDDSSYDERVDDDEVSDDGTYYAKTSSSTIDFDIGGPSSKYVRVFKGTSDSTKGKKISSDISLSSGTNTFVVRVYGSEPDSSIKYEEDDDVKSEYKIKVKYTGSDDSSNSSDTSYDDIYLDRISVDGNIIDLSKTTTAYSYNVGSDTDEVTIKAVPDDTDYTVTIDGNEVNEDDDNYKDDVSLNKGKNEIKIKVEEAGDERVYTLTINRGTTSSTSTSTTTTTDNSDNYDDIYLDRISVDGNIIDLSKSKTVYSYNVDKDTDEVTVKAVPDDTDYTVTIDGNEVNEDDDNYKDDVSLNKGENKIKIEVEDNGDERIYTLIINRGTTSTTDTSTTAEANVVTTTVTTNKWVQVNGIWQYNDTTGIPIKNSWFTDRTLGKEYYLQFNGNMATGWLTNNGVWYYLGTDGAKKTGWQSVGGVWYYLDSQGVMQTGWMKDINGKYYYLNSNGSMASNTKIGAYKLGADGAWIK